MNIDEKIGRENSLVKLLSAARETGLYIEGFSKECCDWHPDWASPVMCDQVSAIHEHVLEAYHEVRAALTHIEYLMHAVGEAE